MPASDKLHILSVIDDLYFGGDEYRLLAFGRTLNRNQFDHTLVTIFSPDSDSEKRHGSLRRSFLESGIDVIHLEESHASEAPRSAGIVQSLRSGATLCRRLKKLCRVIQDRNIDVLDIHLAPANPLGLVAGLIKSRPSAITLYQTMGMEHWLHWLSGQFNLCMADRLITDSEAQKESIRRWTLRRCKACVIPNGTSLRESGFTPAQVRAMLELPADPNVRIIGQISGLIPYKGQMGLLDAAYRVLQQEPNVVFLIVGYVRGDPDYKEQLQQRASALGIAQQVKIVSYAGDIADIWSVIDIHVHASLIDSLPNAILEGMSLGKPAAVAGVGGVSEVIESEETGLIVPPGDPQALATALLRFLRDPELGRRLGRSAYARYHASFRPESMTRKLEQCFLEIAANGGKFE